MNITVERAVLLLRAYCIAVAIVALGSLALAYYVYGSPAWWADFGYGFSGALPESITDGTKAPPPRFLGAFIEGGRTILLLFAVYLILAGAYPGRIAEMLSFRSNDTRRAWPYRIILIAFTLAVLACVIYYHVAIAPAQLADSPKYWKSLAGMQTWWSVGGPEWSQMFSDPTAVADSVKPGTPEFWKMYERTYLSYLPYSISNFGLLFPPMFVIVFYAARSSMQEIEQIRADYARHVRDAGQSCASLLQAASQAGRVTGLLMPSIARWTLAVSAIVAVAVYEAFLGYRTLAALAIMWAIFAYTLCAATFFVLGPSVWRWHLLVTDLSGKIEQCCAGPDCGVSPEDLESAVEALRTHQMSGLLKRTGVGQIAVWAGNALALIAIAVKTAITYSS